MAGFCQILVPNFGVIAKLLHKATKGPDKEPLKWTGETNHAYKTLNTALAEASVLGIPNLAKPFVLYVSERKGIAVGVLTQKLGTETRPVAYLSRKLAREALCWPGCLRAIAATSC
jgi:hypothetical protein